MSRQFFKFLVAGILNTAFGYGLFAALLTIGLHYSISLALSTILGILFNFKSFGKIVFKSKGNKNFIRFLSVYFIGYLVNLSGLALIMKIGISSLFAGAAMVLPSALLTYFLQKKFVFTNA